MEYIFYEATAFNQDLSELENQRRGFHERGL